ncbi:MAG TPA: DsbA family protein, partial [Actinomycetota bacterium]|nr:DsbA family protein [Actinomycetota bacterium]
MTERVRFYFDVLCPWAWQAAVWMREVERVRDVRVDWRLFSLILLNEGRGEMPEDLRTRGLLGARAMAAARRQAGNEGIGRAYEALGRRVHEDGRELRPELVAEAFDEVGLPRELAERAARDGDGSLLADVRRDHEEAVRDVAAFGVPTIVLASGRGMFGPVIATPRWGEEAGEMWDHVRWLVGQEDFFEIKRIRDRGPGRRRPVPSVAQGPS